jgi:hypothetical protein
MPEARRSSGPAPPSSARASQPPASSAPPALVELVWRLIKARRKKAAERNGKKDVL